MVNSDKKQIKHFFQSHQLIKFNKKDIIFRPGDIFSFIYFVKSGFVRVYTDNHNGQEMTIGIYDENSYFPLTGFENKQSEYYFESIGTTELYRVLREDFLEFLKQNHEVAFNQISFTAKVFERFLLISKISTYTNAYFKLLLLFKSFVDNYGTINDDKAIIPMRIPHRVIGSMVGLTRETTSLYMKKLEKEGFVRTSPDKFIITSVKKLEKEIEKSFAL